MKLSTSSSRHQGSCGLLLLATVLFSMASAFSMNSHTTSTNSIPLSSSVEETTKTTPNRRNFLQQASSLAFGVVVVGSSSSPAAAASDEIVVLPTQELVTQTFAPIKFELSDPTKGGVAIMQERIDANDFVGLLEITRGYDLEFRKLRMGRAKKMLQSKELKQKGTEYCNAVTFDLIGMNRNSRPGQENVEGANKYLQELREDVAKFLELESTIQTEG
jgi:hypothetical protein